MSKIMELHLPAEIVHYEGDLRFFFDACIRKLYVNRHKGFADNVSFSDLVAHHNHEMVELLQAVRSEPQFSAYMETVDLGNMAFLLGLFITRLTKDEYQELTVS